MDEVGGYHLIVPKTATSEISQIDEHHNHACGDAFAHAKVFQMWDGRGLWLQEVRDGAGLRIAAPPQPELWS
ncbi:hypothetical protein [Pseudarthrobacter sp. H2]|uniref:hypothetical protein n=1 Tax=Pseudarthrobacter sp. H2 TaxID=3418415 RepID=UPI003CFA1AAF